MANHTTEHRTEDGRIIKPVSIPRQVGLYARREREAQGLTRKQLAKAAGVSEPPRQAARRLRRARA